MNGRGPTKADARRAAAGVKREKTDRDGSAFLALPFDVLRSAGWRAASHTARSLLLDVCQQDPRERNGRLVITPKALEPLGWRSESAMRNARDELMELGLLIQTRAGSRNSAAWYAVTWRGLDWTTGLDIDPKVWDSVHRGAYRKPAGKGRRVRRENALAAPSEGVHPTAITPCGGVQVTPRTPWEGAVRPETPAICTPWEGVYLRKTPSPAAKPARQVRMGVLLAIRCRDGPKPAAYQQARDRIAASLIQTK